jgi:hypothetical protein
MEHPGEFRYWDNIDKPLFRRVRALGRWLGFDPALPDPVVATLGAMYYDADPLAEAFVEEVYFTRGMEAGRALLDQALTRGIASMSDPPASLVALFADIEQDPSWLDQALVELGARTFRRYGSAVFRFAGALTLMAYAENSVAKPLVLTGAYTGGSTKHRFLETAAFWIDVTEPGGTRPGAAGRAAALRVRIMHVFVRKRLLAHPEWNLEAWGAPISQADALLTLMGGSVGPGLAMRAMGYRPSRREIEAMMHFWRYVGHLMGVRPRWYPGSIREGLQLLFVTLVKGANAAGEDGRKLCQSFAEAFREPEQTAPLARLRARFHDGVHRGYTRFFTPPWTYRQMEMPPAGLWALHPLLQFPFIFTAETLRRHVPALEHTADRVARASRRRWLARHQAGHGAAYRPAQNFTR